MVASVWSSVLPSRTRARARRVAESLLIPPTSHASRPTLCQASYREAAQGWPFCAENRWDTRSVPTHCSAMLNCDDQKSSLDLHGLQAKTGGEPTEGRNLMLIILAILIALAI